MKAAIKHEGDINLRNSEASSYAVASIFSAPLLCAITHNNLEAFMYLLDQGSDMDLVACLKCKLEKTRRNPLIIAAQHAEYKMVHEILMRRGAGSLLETRQLIFAIKRFPVNPKSEAKQWQLKVIDWLRDQGHEVEPWTIEKIKKKRS